jgi:hypothetical protein
MMAVVMSQEEAMGQVTLRGVDEKTGNILTTEARRRGKSVNRTVLELLREAMGQADERGLGRPTFDDLDHLAGTWSAEDAAELLAAAGEHRAVDGGLWR